jgi:hypothetical protein
MTRAKKPNRPILFTVHESPQLPRPLWEQFKQESKARGETWIAALRRLIERYLAEKGDTP